MTMTDFDHKNFLANLSKRPGVYRMLDENGEVLYVGKARNLRQRVGSYFRASGLTTRALIMVSKIADIQITVTRNETEALLLEQSLIKSARPLYNIQLKDDKSYPYILLTDKDEYPRLAFYRGSRRQQGKFYGPFPSAHATRETLGILQKVFRVRQCEDSYFSNRSRPCLQYQIDRCTGPCVGLVSPEEYAEDVRYSRLFLEGKSDVITKELAQNMEAASAAEDFEKAALIRDKIIHLRQIQEEQFVANQGGDADVMAAVLQQPYACIHCIYVRAGRIVGSKSLFPRFRLAESAAEVLGAFVSQTYLADSSSSRSTTIPDEIIVSETLAEQTELQAALAYVAGRKIKLSVGSAKAAKGVRGYRAKWLELATTNAQESLQGHIGKRQNVQQRFADLQEALGLQQLPCRIECFDISHTAGEGTVASCVVFDVEGAVKNDYRRFNIEDVEPGDDYGAMAQVLQRRFTRLLKEEGKLPDILMVDGGKGQLAQARQVLQQLGVERIVLLGIAKGPSRRAGQETLFLQHSSDGSGDDSKNDSKSDAAPRQLNLPAVSPALHLLQQVRDEAHRFAISGHRQRRSKARQQSTLEQIPGLGPKRRRELLRHFGGQRQVAAASADELAKVSGISHKLAENIYGYLHDSSP